MADHSILQPGNLLMVQERERFLARFLRKNGWPTLDSLRAFEAGCSTGYNMRLFVQWGARPEHIAGIDLDPDAVDYCKAHSPEIRVHAGSADAVPEPDATFDLAIAFTLFSSVPDEEISAGIARELRRVTKPGGFIIIYDMRRRNPGNRAVHPVTKEDVRRWFPRSPMRTRSITLAPPLARRAGQWAPWLYGPLAAVPLLRTHAIYILRNPLTP
ncbi:MAG: class I SAM-dependent methyltransferase [Dehalococcoidia bacterium]|uniref:class I SAM-dependent methyltransferase n=1 Tax=Candidatus Amarobacter glycogenicus TaxID=3140699 RepID=UPI002A0C7F13|nr:class I SAM-dependent methyltransferase [Dehalococcoidia bacterium]MBK6561222.1 class I SAM-dependent methyltransferase [Dehalococcoidia bacterium]MBK7125197.1 class I SAM-dependent methyltransferase [Dehalococcoidia bacterium]MBK7330125.1 class I SAM-dependent methyltransferase [Dehalococcoidia bacterium]MBK8558762.1 class I SAM-dependent methyltransferase [Dehalococcoidia bacterium]